MDRPPRRSSYMLRIWQERPATADAPAVWRLSVEDVRTGERWAFPDLEGMLTFLRERMAEA